MIIPTLHTKAVFIAKDITSNMHFSHKAIKPAKNCAWSHVNKNRSSK